MLGGQWREGITLRSSNAYYLADETTENTPPVISVMLLVRPFFTPLTRSYEVRCSACLCLLAILGCDALVFLSVFLSGNIIRRFRKVHGDAVLQDVPGAADSELNTRASELPSWSSKGPSHFFPAATAIS